MIRPAEHLILGTNGPVAMVDGRVCAILDRLLKLSRVRAEVRGQDTQLDQTLLAIRLAGIAYTESTAVGTTSAPKPEPAPHSTQQLDNTISTTTAAATLGMTDRAIRKAINEKRLPAINFDGRYRITQQDLAAFAATR